MAFFQKNLSELGNISGYVGSTGADLLVHIGPTDPLKYQDIEITTYGGGGSAFLYYSLDGGTTKFTINGSSATITTKFRIQGNATPVRVYINTSTVAASCYGFVNEITNESKVTALGFSQTGAASIKTGVGVTNFLVHIGPTDTTKYQDILIKTYNGSLVSVSYSIDGGTTIKTLNNFTTGLDIKFRIRGNATPLRIYYTGGGYGQPFIMGFIQEVTP